MDNDHELFSLGILSFLREILVFPLHGSLFSALPFETCYSKFWDFLKYKQTYTVASACFWGAKLAWFTIKNNLSIYGKKWSEYLVLVLRWWDSKREHVRYVLSVRFLPVLCRFLAAGSQRAVAALGTQPAFTCTGVFLLSVMTGYSQRGNVQSRSLLKVSYDFPH